LLTWNESVEGFHKRLLELKSPQTAATYVYAVRSWEQFLQEKKIRLDTAHPGLLDDFARWMIARGCKPQTVASRCTGVKAWLKHLKRLGYKVPDLMSPDLPKVISKDPVVLSMDELALYFEAANDIEEPVRTAMLVMPLCGLRSDEVVRIQLDQLRVKDGWIIFTFLGKGQKPRSVPLLKQGNPIVRDYLQVWRANQRHKNGNNFLFPGVRSGKHLATRTVRKWVDEVSRQIGIPDLSPHVLRKTYTTMLDAMGVSPLMIAQLVGHSSLKTTSKHYVKHNMGTIVNSLARVNVPGLVGP
jgi:site-specific recombinase XerD